MKFLSDQEGIMSRFLKEKKNWEPHLVNSRNFILECLSGKGLHRITVLGSGWLLDVPLVEMKALCDEILLVDIYHPPQVLRRIRDLPGITAVNHDITGGIVEEVYHLVKEFRNSRVKKSLSELPAGGYKPVADPGYIISLNVLNQLDMLIVDYLKRYGIYSEMELLDLRKRIQQDHLLSLPGNRSCLITDYEEVVYRNNRIESRKSLVHIPLPDGKRNTTWEWRFDTLKSYHPGHSTVFNVTAIEI